METLESFPQKSWKLLQKCWKKAAETLEKPSSTFLKCIVPFHVLPFFSETKIGWQGGWMHYMYIEWCPYYIWRPWCQLDLFEICDFLTAADLNLLTQQPWKKLRTVKQIWNFRLLPDLLLSDAHVNFRPNETNLKFVIIWPLVTLTSWPNSFSQGPLPIVQIWNL